MHCKLRYSFLLSVFAALPVVLVLFLDSAHAYIDPGTGNVIYTSLATIIAFGAGILGVVFWPVKRLIRRLRSNRSSGRTNSNPQ